MFGLVIRKRRQAAALLAPARISLSRQSSSLLRVGRNSQEQQLMCMVSVSEPRLLTGAGSQCWKLIRRAAATRSGPENKVSEFCFNLQYVSNSLQHIAP